MSTSASNSNDMTLQSYNPQDKIEVVFTNVDANTAQNLAKNYASVLSGSYYSKRFKVLDVLVKNKNSVQVVLGNSNAVVFSKPVVIQPITSSGKLYDVKGYKKKFVSKGISRILKKPLKITPSITTSSQEVSTPSIMPTGSSSVKVVQSGGATVTPNPRDVDRERIILHPGTKLDYIFDGLTEQQWFAKTGLDGSGQKIMVIENERVLYAAPDFADRIYWTSAKLSTDSSSAAHNSLVINSAAGSGKGSNGELVGPAPKSLILFTNSLFTFLNLDAAIDKHVDVISESQENNGVYTNELPLIYGIPYVIAAGNSGAPGFLTVDGFNTIKGGASREVISVGSSYPDNDVKLSYWASKGPAYDTTYLKGNAALVKPDVLAPGDHICVLAPTSGIPRICAQNGNPDYQFVRGTSISAPVVAGSILLLKQNNPSITPSQIRSAVINYADNLNDPSGVPYTVFEQGGGTLNVRRAKDAKVFFTPATLSFYSGDADSTSSVVSIQNTFNKKIGVRVKGNTFTRTSNHIKESFDFPTSFSDNDFCLNPSQVKDLKINLNWLKVGIYSERFEFSLYSDCNFIVDSIPFEKAIVPVAVTFIKPARVSLDESVLSKLYSDYTLDPKSIKTSFYSFVKQSNGNQVFTWLKDCSDFDVNGIICSFQSSVPLKLFVTNYFELMKNDGSRIGVIKDGIYDYSPDAFLSISLTAGNPVTYDFKPLNDLGFNVKAFNLNYPLLKPSRLVKIESKNTFNSLQVFSENIDATAEKLLNNKFYIQTLNPIQNPVALFVDYQDLYAGNSFNKNTLLTNKITFQIDSKIFNKVFNLNGIVFTSLFGGSTYVDPSYASNFMFPITSNVFSLSFPSKCSECNLMAILTPKVPEASTITMTFNPLSPPDAVSSVQPKIVQLDPSTLVFDIGLSKTSKSILSFIFYGSGVTTIAFPDAIKVTNPKGVSTFSNLYVPSFIYKSSFSINGIYTYEYFINSILPTRVCLKAHINWNGVSLALKDSALGTEENRQCVALGLNTPSNV